MTKFNMTAVAAAIGVIFSTAVMAETLSKDAYKAARDGIATEYTSEKNHCDSLSGNPKDICVAEAKGKQEVANAELAARYEPTTQNHYKARIAKAEADYAVANEKCDDKAGNDQDICVKEAKAVQTRIKADAEAQLKISDAKQAANDESAEARSVARAEGVEARQEAMTDKRDANYAVAREKCDALEGDAKDRCIDNAKTRYSN